MRYGLLAAAFVFCAAASSGENAGSAERRAAYRHWDAGVALVLSGNYKEARTSWERCLGLDPQNDDCRAGLKLMSIRDVSKVANMGIKTARKMKASKRKEKNKASSRSKDGPVPAGDTGSEEAKKQAIKHWNNGIIYFQKEEYKNAVKEWKSCVELDPENQDCRIGLQRLSTATFGGN